MASGPFKDRLMGALHEAVQHFNSDNNPNAAVVKAARDNDFNIDQTQRLLEMFNTARTLYHYKSAGDRTNEFALADPDAVMADLFKDDPQPQAKTAAYVSYSDYDVPERSRHEPTYVEKAAALQTPTDEQLSVEALSRQAMLALRETRQTAKIASDEARIAGSMAGSALTRLARCFAAGIKSANEDKYARLVTGYGKDPEYGPVLAKLAEFVPEKDKAPAALMAKYARHAVIDDRDLGTELALLKEARDWMSVEAEMLAASGVLEKEASAFEVEYLEALQVPTGKTAAAGLSDFIRPEIVKAAQVSRESTYETRNLLGDKVMVTEKSDPAGVGLPQFFDAVPSLAAGALKKPLETIDVERAFTAPAARQNRALSERLKNVQRGIMLQDLMTNDPVLSEETPETVAEAFNAILQLAPEMASNKEVVRAVLRQTVHSVAVSPYDAEIWTKLEKNLQNIRGKGVRENVA